jgi:hypothetical protein
MDRSGSVDTDQTTWNARLIETVFDGHRKRSMSAHGTRIWVLITDGASSRLCSCHDGMATPITAPLFDLYGTASDGRDVEAYRAWFKAEPQKRLSQNPRRQHVWHVSQLLLEGACEGAYDGLVIIAAAPVAAELEEALAPETRALLIGNIVHDSSCLEPDAACEQQDIRH